MYAELEEIIMVEWQQGILSEPDRILWRKHDERICNRSILHREVEYWYDGF